LRLALDTNILVHAEGFDSEVKREATGALLQKLPDGSVCIPVQALGELFNVLIRKAGRSRQDARAAVLSWHDAYPVIGTAPGVMIDALELAAQHRLAIWDCVILAAAAEGGCRFLLSEDMQDGFTWRGATIVDPFAPNPPRLLAEWLPPQPS
jgi:predicted nucleic acid-binding protein